MRNLEFLILTTLHRHGLPFHVLVLLNFEQNLSPSTRQLPAPFLTLPARHTNEPSALYFIVPIVPRLFFQFKFTPIISDEISSAVNVLANAGAIYVITEKANAVESNFNVILFSNIIILLKLHWSKYFSSCLLSFQIN